MKDNNNSSKTNFLKLAQLLGTPIRALSLRQTQVITRHFTAACKNKQKQFANCTDNYIKHKMHYEIAHSINLNSTRYSTRQSPPPAPFVDQLRLQALIAFYLKDNDWKIENISRKFVNNKNTQIPQHLQTSMTQG